MSDQFARTALLLGSENIDKLKNRRVAVFGIGGVGGHTVESLCRTGVGAIDIFDGDVVDVTNLNRQIIATHKTIGRDKVDVMRERLLEINPDLKIEAHKLFYLPDTADGVDLSVYDYIVDAVDTMTAKLELVCRSAAAGAPVISSMGAANKLDPSAFEVADVFETSFCPMARIMRRELRKRGVNALKVVYSKEPPVKPIISTDESEDAEKSNESDQNTEMQHMTNTPFLARRRQIPASSAFAPAVAGLILAAEVVNGLLK